MAVIWTEKQTFDIVTKMLNQNQKKILIIAAAVVAAMLIFPPFVLQLPHGQQLFAGYYFILSNPEMFGGKPVIDVAVLATQWLGVLIVTALCFFAARTETSLTNQQESLHEIH